MPYKKHVTRLLLPSLIAGLFMPIGAHANEADLLNKIDALTKQLEQLKAQVQASQQENKTTADAVNEVKQKVQRNEDKSLDKWFSISGDYQFRYDYLSGKTVAYMQPMPDANSPGGVVFAPMPAYRPKNNAMFSNRLGLNINAKATENVSLTTRLLMYKTWGNNNDSAISGTYFADRIGVFDGTLGHVPSSSYINVDRVYATWSNIADKDIWFSVGRRPSTDGSPRHLSQNDSRPGTGGAPALLVDYAFDGLTLGWAPEIDSLPGAFAKLCYGRGFESGYRSPLTNSLKDTDMMGLSIVPIDTDRLRINLQYSRGLNIFDTPTINSPTFGYMSPKANVGDIDWIGVDALGVVKRLGPGDLNWFADFGMSRTHPNSNRNDMGMGLLTGGLGTPGSNTGKTGNAIYLGLRYDLTSRTKFGFEYNRGSKNWITFAPASYDAWTSKVGVRGSVYEVYAIQELDQKSISSRLAKAFFRFGLQYYNFKYTGSNNWMGAPVGISSITDATPLAMTPLTKAYNIYATFEVKF